MSRPRRALLDLADPWDQREPSDVQLATERELDAERMRHDRRAHKRHRDHELQWIRQARLSAGHAVSIVDLSSGGALVDSPVPLRPDSILTMEIGGRGFDKAVQFKVLRCEIGALHPGQTTYRGACEFTSAVALPAGDNAAARVLYPGRFVGLDLALQRLLESTSAESASDPQIDRTPNRIGSKAPAEASDSTYGWQKIVVRYVEGQILKGYTQDFSTGRSQFSLWPSLNSAPRERVIVPLARLKGVFFVRDFAGNPGYVERLDTDQPQHGRRIEATLVDGEVIAGRTLNYRPDGYGFFVVPADPLANNIRVFIVSTAVRQVRFP